MSGRIGSENINNIDSFVSLGLLGVPNSLGYLISAIEKEADNDNKCYGYSAASPEKWGLNSVIAFGLTGGNAAFGTELQVHDGTVVEAGSATKKFRIRSVDIPTIGTANVNTFIELFYGSRDAGQIGFFLNTGDFIGKRGAAAAATTEFGADTLTPAGAVPANDTRIVLDTIAGSTGISNDIIYYVVNAAALTFQISLASGGAPVDITVADGTCNFSIVTAHGLADGTKIMLSGAGMPAQWNVETVYYVVNSTALTFQVSLTVGGAAVTVASAGQITFHAVTQTLLTSFYVCSALNTPDGYSKAFPCPRIACNSRVWMRAWSNGATNAIGLLFNVTSYAA